MRVSSTVRTSDARRPRYRRLIIGLGALGVLVCAYLQLLHLQIYLGLGGSGYCEVGARLSCTSVALSRASVVLGVPLPVWGLAGFVALATAAWRRSRLLLPLAGFAALASVALLIYELAAVGSLCLWCELVHVLAFACLALAWLARGALASELGPRALAVELGPAALLVLGVALFAPAYWMSASWGSGLRLPHGVDEHGRPWLGAEAPELVVHEYVDYACPHCRIAAARMKMRLAEDRGLRVVRHHQPRMRCGTEPSRAERCLFARVAICGGEQDAFWEMDDWLFHHAPGSSGVELEQAAADLDLDLDELRTCVESAAAHVRAQADVDEARARAIRGTPGYVVDNERLDQDQLHQLLNAR